MKELARLWARNTTFDSVSVGDELPILVKWETAETIKKFRELAMPDQPVECPGNPDSDNTPAACQAMLSYATELLEKGFPLESITARGSGLRLVMLTGVQPEDTISLSGYVVGKDTQRDFNRVQCVVRIENQDNELVAEVDATIAL